MINLIILAAAALLCIGLYNSVITAQQKVDESQAGVDVQLKKRWDLIPNLVNTVRRYTEHEEGLLTQITKIRATAVEAADEQETVSDQQIGGCLKKLGVVVENYPELKADTSFIALQRSLNEVESRIAAARRAYNANVRVYNSKCEHFPTNIIARLRQLQPYSYYEVPDDHRENVDVQALFTENR